jgi:subtilisin-like proprotein convertase family protein
VQSAGNSFSLGDDTNLHNFQNSQYIITVAATDYSGNVTSYSSPGASVLVAAPGGGGTDPLSDIVTADRVGVAGTSTGDYSTTAGTSFSAPIVSGIVALMLEANPNLGYRDVQEILAYSAREISSTSNDWRYNGASNWNGGGLHYDALSHNLGYGLVDALAAVRLAETWTGTGHIASNREQITATHNVSKVIPDGGGINAVASAFDAISVTQSIDVERTEVTLNVTHPYVGDLSVLLTSPSGTTSFLLWRPQQNALSAYGTNQDNIQFTFDTVLDWGESSVGSWGLSIFDNATGDTGTFDSWTLNLIGKPASADDTYIYTNEFAAATADQAARSILSDTGGTDTLNAAACTANLVLNLVPGTVSTIDGRSLTIAAGTVIENAYGGDGNDVITGNSATNALYGMRGNDTLIGGSGNDTLDGGAGTDTALFSGPSNNYQLGFADDKWTVHDKTGVDGTDTIMNFENIQFANKTVITESMTPGSYTDLPESLWHFFIVAFNAAPGVEYMNQLAEAYHYGYSVQKIVDVFTTKHQFTDVYATSLSHVDMANALVGNIVKNSASADVKQGAIDDIKAALDIGWTIGEVVYTVFGNLAGKPLNDPTWGTTAQQFQNEIAVAKYYTTVMDQSTTDLPTLREVLAPVNQYTDISTSEHIATLIGVALMA